MILSNRFHAQAFVIFPLFSRISGVDRARYFYPLFLSSSVFNEYSFTRVCSALAELKMGQGDDEEEEIMSV